MALYALASLTPAVLIAIACIEGGIWPLLALIYITLIVFVLDSLAFPDLPSDRSERSERHGRLISACLGLTHFILLVLGIRALSGATPLETGQLIALGFSLGIYFGQVSNAVAHELIHSPRRWSTRLGTAIYVSLLFGHHTSAHLKVHHTWAATDRDPNTAKVGESFFHFWPKAWFGSFREGLRAENALRAHVSPAPSALSHPYVIYGLGSVAALVVSAMIGGWRGIAVHVLLAVYAQAQLMMSDYVQHYGLSRKNLANGRPEPVGPAHSWNATPWYSGAMLLNAPRHSEHHMHPGHAFPGLDVDKNSMPVLPSTLPVMGLIAACPPLWRRIMDHRVHKIADSQAPGGETDADLTDFTHVSTVADSDPSAGLSGEGTADDGRSV